MAQKKINDFQEYEMFTCKLPNWYKDWIVANGVSIEELTPEYVYICNMVRGNLQRIS